MSKDVLLLGYLCLFEQPHPQWPNRQGVYCYVVMVIIPLFNNTKEDFNEWLDRTDMGVR